MNYLQKVIDKIKQELPEAEIFLFGSYVNGNFRKNSDYDIGIIWGDKKIPLSKLSKIQFYVDELPIRVDIVDFNSVDEKFRKMVFEKEVSEV